MAYSPPASPRRPASTLSYSSSDMSSEPVTPTQSTMHPFAHSKALLEILPNKIDIEEEVRLYDELYSGPGRPRSPTISVLSQDQSDTNSLTTTNASIWLADNSGASTSGGTFSRDVKIAGWTNVGDTDKFGGGGYVVYDCVITTKEGTTIHAHKRYTAFEDLEADLRRTLPRAQRRFVPALPPKAPLARYRPAFLDRRRVLLQHWLSSILLHPDVGGCKAVREWVMD